VNDFLPHDLLHGLISATIPVANILGDLQTYMRDFLAWIESLVGNWGVAIIILTIIVRIVIFPLTWKQIRSQMAMQSLAPKIKEIQAKHKGDKQRIQQETMRLYQEYRVNPLASCFPLLLQLPVFILLYYSIRNYPPLQDAQFLWFTLGLPDPYYILLVIYVVSQLISTELMLTPETQAQQKWIMRLMPLIFVAFLYKFPSGLFVYWITTNLWTIGQVMVVRYMRKNHPLELKAVDPSAPRKRNRFMDAMTAAQSQREGGGAPAGGRSTGKPSSAIR
jgi:YidC/Oxa1 family membrane protein insertase